MTPCGKAGSDHWICRTCGSEQIFDARPFSVSITHDPARRQFVLFVNNDSGALELERQLALERRELTILEDQARAAGRLIREKEALYRDIVESSADLVVRLGRDLRVAFVNQRAIDLIGAPLSHITGRPIEQLFPTPQDEPTWAQWLTDKSEASFEQFAHAGENDLWIWWNVHWLGENGGPGEYQAVGRDITALRRLRAQAEQGSQEARNAAVMRERLRIAHDLHDTLVQSLAALVPQLRLIRKVAGPNIDPTLADELARAETAAKDGLTRARAAISEIRNHHIQPEGLGAALEGVANRFSARTGINVLLDIDPACASLQGDNAETLFRIVEEALRNAEWHAEPERVGIYLTGDDMGAATLVVADDGRGFDASASFPDHYGLIGMREQADMIGAHFAIDSAPGAGTRIEIKIPRPKVAR